MFTLSSLYPATTLCYDTRSLRPLYLFYPAQVEVASKYSTVDTLRQQYLFVPAKYKDCYLAFILNELSGSTSMVWGAVRCGTVWYGALRCSSHLSAFAESI